SEGLIREAMMRELKRGGQIYFLHNEVDSIERMRERLVRLLPEARIAVAHGQMRERELERVMREFNAQRSSLLLCSTIIESGIDIPTANTMVIHRADKFGLAQLHQLRGRVGRSHHQAYAYLLTPPEDALGAQAKKRLEAIREELVDRFGELPEPARALLECHQVRIAARPLGVSRVDATHEAVQLQFVKNPPLDGAKVIEFVRARRNARLTGPERIRVEA